MLKTTLAAQYFVFLGSVMLVTSPALVAKNGITLSYLGTAGWGITNGKVVILIDPYLSRLKTVTPNDSVLPEDTRPLITSEDFVNSDQAVIDARITRADCILITHTHFDHAMDMPYIAKKYAATVVGTESTINFAKANGVPDAQVITVKGGEDYQFPAFSVRVIPSLHGVLRRAPNRSSAAGGQRPTVFPAGGRAPFNCVISLSKAEHWLTWSVSAVCRSWRSVP